MDKGEKGPTMNEEAKGNEARNRRQARDVLMGARRDLHVVVEEAMKFCEFTDDLDQNAAISAMQNIEHMMCLLAESWRTIRYGTDKDNTNSEIANAKRLLKAFANAEGINTNTANLMMLISHIQHMALHVKSGELSNDAAARWICVAFLIDSGAGESCFRSAGEGAAPGQMLIRQIQTLQAAIDSIVSNEKKQSQWEAISTAAHAFRLPKYPWKSLETMAAKWKRTAPGGFRPQSMTVPQAVYQLRALLIKRDEWVRSE